MRVLLVNPNTNAATTEAMVAIAREAAPSDDVEGATVAFGAPLLVDETLLAQGAEAVAALFRARDLAGYDGAIVAAFGDPGLDAARAACAVPVTGIAEAGMSEAAAGGRRFAVVTTTPLLAGAIARRVEALGLARAFAGVRLTDGDVHAVMADPTRLEEALADACAKSIRHDGVEAIVIGGGPLARAARALSKQFPIPIVEPIPAAMRLARARSRRA